MEKISEKIAERRSHVERLKADVTRLQTDLMIAEVELRAYEHALSLCTGAAVEPPTPPTPAQTLVRRMRARASAERTLTGLWLETMRALGHLEIFTVDDVLSAASARGHTPSRDNIRSQIFNYKKRGIVAAVGIGRYSFTQKGRSELGLGSPVTEAASKPAAPETVTH